jgi:hypothetical protein
MDAGRILVFVGIAITLAGTLVWLGARLGLGRLPGDIIVERDNFTFAFPLSTSIVVSVILTIVLNIALRLR